MRDFTNYEYQQIVDFLTEKYSEKPGLSDSYQGSTAQTLIQLNADSVDSLAYMLERRSQEAFLETARLTSSIWARASELGYRPKRSVASTGTIRLDIFDEAGNPVQAIAPIVIPRLTSVFLGDREFLTMEDATIEEGEDHVYIQIKEGSLVSNVYNFDEEPYLSDSTIAIEEYMNIEEYSIEISDSVGPYSFILESDMINKNITSLSYATEDDRLYDIKFSREGMRIVMGDGIFGYKPQGNVEVKWILSEGRTTVLRTGVEFQFEFDFITDTATPLPANVYLYRIENTTPIRGANEPEDIVDIVRNAPLSARAANRCVTSADYEYWTLRSGIGDIIDVNVYGEQDTGSLIFNMNNVYMSYLTSDNLALNVEQRIALREYLDRFKVTTTHIVITMADQISIVLDIDFRRERNLPISDEQLYTVLKGYIDEYFRLRRGSIGREIQHSEFVKFLQSRDFVFNDVNYKITDFVKVSMEAQYPVNLPAPVYDIKVFLDTEYVINDGDEWKVIVNGDEIVVTVEDTDNFSSLLEKMREAIFLQSNLLTAIDSANNAIRLKSVFVDEVFTIDVTEGDLASYVTTDIFYYLPTPTNNPFSLDNAILPGSVYIIDEDENVLFRDDGEGTMEPEDGVLYGAFEIDYVNAYLISPTMSEGNYYVRFQQNEFQNFKANSRAAIVMSPLKDQLEDDDLFSRLRLI